MRWKKITPTEPSMDELVLVTFDVSFYSNVGVGERVDDDVWYVNGCLADGEQPRWWCELPDAPEGEG